MYLGCPHCKIKGIHLGGDATLKCLFNACFYIFVDLFLLLLCSLLVERATLHWKLIQFALSNWIPSVSNQSTPEKAFDRCPHCYSLAVAGIAFAIRCRNDMDSFSWWNTRSESFVSHRPKATYTEMATSWRNPWTKVLKLSPICFADHLSCTAQSIQSPFAKGAEGYVCWEQVTPRAGKNSFIQVVRPWSVRFCFLFGDPNLEAKPPLVLGISTPLSGWPFFWQNLDEVRTICWWKQPCQRYHSFFQRRFQVAFVRETSTVIEYSNMDVSENRGTPKWMVYNGKPY